MADPLRLPVGHTRRDDGVRVAGDGATATVSHRDDGNPVATLRYAGQGKDRLILIALRYTARLWGPTLMVPAGQEAQAIALAVAWVRGRTGAGV